MNHGYLSPREMTLIKLSGEVVFKFSELNDFKEATKFVANANPDYSNELWEAYFISIKTKRNMGTRPTDLTKYIIGVENEP